MAVLVGPAISKSIFSEKTIVEHTKGFSCLIQCEVEKKREKMSARFGTASME